MRRWITQGVAAVALLTLPTTAWPQSAADFYKGRNIDLYIGYSSGGAYDLYGRLVARFMAKYIPGNPTIVPKNMSGAGSLVLANWLYNVAPKDGSAFGIIGRGTGFDPLLGNQKAQFDGTKFTWLGSANNEVSVCVAWHTSGVKTFEDLLSKELVVGGTGTAADTDQFPRIMNGVLGTRFKIVTGYPGGNEVGLAMERGEVQGRCGWSWSSVRATHPRWYDEKLIHVLVQLALDKHRDLPHVPLVVELAKSDEQRRILELIFARQVMGRPFLAPPGIPRERAEVLRRAFMDTMNDPEFLSTAEKAQMEITPVPGDRVEKLVKDLYATPAPITQKAAALLARK